MKKKEIEQIQAFIAAPVGQFLGVLKEELANRNVKAYTAYDFPPSTANIEQAMKKSNLIIAVISKEASPNVFFELGMAHAMKKPFLVFVSPSFGTLPSDISGTLYFRTDIENRSAIGFALDQCIDRLQRPPLRPQKQTKGEEIPLGKEKANRFLTEIKQKGIELSEQELERIVAEILKAAGVKTIIERPHQDIGADIVIWLDALQSIAGNPILVEVKSRIRSHEEFIRALEQVERYRQNSNSKLALLVVNQLITVLSSIPFVGGVLAIAITDLVERLRTKTLSETVLELRNESIHGGGK